MILRKSALISSPPNSLRKNFSLRAYSIGPIIVPTLGTVLCRYCHLSCKNIPKPAYADWGFRRAILPKTLTLWAHASTWGFTHASSWSHGPRYAPKYRLPLIKFKSSPSFTNSRFVASSCPGVSEMKINLAGSGKCPWSSPLFINSFKSCALGRAEPSNAASFALKSQKESRIRRS